jgi:Ca2+-binding RTX toxin-like protein
MSEYTGQDSGTLRVTIREAAARLGVTEAAIRKRIQRGSLDKEMGKTRGGSHLMRRRALLILATMGLGVLLLVLLGGVALAATIDGTTGPDDLVGTDQQDVIDALGGEDYVSGLAAADVLYAGAGNDTVVGRDGPDRIYGNTGSDKLFGKRGKDTINSGGDQEKDVVKCGRGKADTALVDKIDWVKENCENVYLRVG